MKPLALSVMAGLLAVALCGEVKAYEPIGTVEWAHAYGGENHDASYGICGMPEGSFYVSGCYGSLDCPSDPLFVVHHFGLEDIFLAKYNGEGDLLWVRSAGSAEQDLGHGVSALPDGTCVISGAYGGNTASCTFGYGQPNQTILPEIGKFDVYVAKYDGQGTLQWAKWAGGPAEDYSHDIALTADGSVYVAGQFWGPSITFGHGLPTQTTLSKLPEDPGLFLARYDTNGVFQWALHEPVLQVVALSDGSCVVTTFTGVARYAADGSKVWSNESMPAHNTAVTPLEDNAFAVVYEVSGLWASRFQANPDGTVSEVWKIYLPDCWIDDLAPISTRPDGAFSFFGLGAGRLYTVAADGSWFSSGALGLSVYAMCYSGDANYCYLTGNFQGNLAVGGTTLINQGDTDFFVVRAISMERYAITALCQGPGWIQFNSPDAKYWNGATAVLTAVSIFPESFRFVEWGGDLAGLTEPTVTFPMTNDMAVTAVFEHIEGTPELPAASGTTLATLIAGLAVAGVRAQRKKRAGPSRFLQL